MPPIIEAILRNSVANFAARVLLTFPFWGSGLAKLLDFETATADMARFGLVPPAVFAVAVIVTQLGGAALVILDRHAWLGAGALGVFTALTIPIVHHFWSMTEEPFRTIAFHTATEHVGMIGALIVVSMLSAFRRREENVAGRVSERPFQAPATGPMPLPE